jgi:peroxiredoxin
VLLNRTIVLLCETLEKDEGMSIGEFASFIYEAIFNISLLRLNHKDLNMSKILAPKTLAPDFTLRVTADQTLSLNELKDKVVILAFYPADWSPVCGDQMSLLNEVLPEFRKYGAQLLGISVDGVWCHDAFAAHQKLHFPLLADFEPKGAIAKQYGAYREQEGCCERALFVIDKKGIITWSYLSPVAENPGVDGILEALEALPK